MTKKVTLAALTLLALLAIACSATVQAPSTAQPTPVRKVSVVIASEPGDAEIYLDGRLVGTTTMELRLSEGNYKVEVRRSGFKPWARDLAVADYATRVTALLERE